MPLNDPLQPHLLHPQLSCPHCGWPVRTEPVRASSHPTRDGAVHYLQCVCGSWLLLHDGELLASTGGW